MHADCALQLTAATSQITLHGALHTDHLVYIPCCYCNPCFWSSSLLSKVSSPRLTWLHPSLEHCQVAD